jgi:phage terminase large subunit-like protein
MGSEAELQRLLRAASRLEGEALERFLKGLPAPVRRMVGELWSWQAHGGQREPRGEWRVWVIRAGRGFGKTRAGAEWVWARVRETPGAQVALVGANIDDVRKVMVEGESGLARAARTGEWARWVASRQRVEFSCGAVGFAYSGERPEKLRGPQHHFAWCDELAKWARAEDAWDNLRLGMRLGERPRIVVTTTPKTMALLKRIEAEERCVVTRGRTWENAHVPEDFLEAVTGLYAGTRLGRQELDGELIEDADGALWTRETLEGARESGTFARGEMKRIVVGVDPPASAGGDACGIVVCGKGADGMLWVLADHSVRGLRPEGWARAVVAAAEAWGADRVVAEKNQGGDMVESVLRSVESALPVKMVAAVLGKAARAEPVAALFEAGKARLAGAFPQLEDELAGMTIAGGYCGPGRSPDRADALVWAMSELAFGREAAEARVRRL